MRMLAVSPGAYDLRSGTSVMRLLFSCRHETNALDVTQMYEAALILRLPESVAAATALYVPPSAGVNLDTAVPSAPVVSVSLDTGVSLLVHVQNLFPNSSSSCTLNHSCLK